MKIRDLLKSEFAKIDADGSGEIDAAEFEALVVSMGVEIVDDVPSNLVGVEDVLLALPGGDGATLAGFGFVVEERCASRTERSLWVRGVKAGSAAEAAGARNGDELARACGVELAAVAADLGEEFVDHHPLDALTTRCDMILKEAPVASLGARRRAAFRIPRRYLGVLWRAVDADGSGDVACDEIEQFVVDAPEEGEAEFAAVLEGLRTTARDYYDAALPEPSPVVQAFAAIADVAKKRGKDAKNSLPTSALGAWARSLQLPGGSRVSRRQSALLGDRLDANGDGVVSRSEFADWLFPRRPLDDLKRCVGGVVDGKYGGKVAHLWAKLASRAPEAGVGRGDAQRKFRDAGLGYVSPAEVDDLLAAAGSKDVLHLEALCHVLGRPVEPLPAAAKPPPSPRRRPSPTKARPPETARPATAPASSKPSKPKRSLSSRTPRDFARARAERAEAAAARGLAAAADREATPPPAPAWAEEAAHAATIARLQASARRRALDGAADALRRERTAVNELEAALVREAALQVELSRARCATKAAVRDATAELKRRVADLEDERDVERGAFDDQLRRLLDEKARAEAEARAAKAALSDAQLDERRRAATHYRKKLDAYKKAHPPAPPKKKDALDFGPPPPRPDPLNETIGKGNTT